MPRPFRSHSAGLSYNNITATAIDVSPRSVAADVLLASTLINVTVDIENTSGPAGLAVVEVFFNVTAPTRRARFASALLGFAKVSIGAAPATARAVISVPVLNMAVWDSSRANYTLDVARHGVWVAPHSGAPPTVSTWFSVTAPQAVATQD